MEPDCDEVIAVPNDERPDSLKAEPAPYSPPLGTQRLIDELYREEVLEARRIPPAEKALAGQQLFEAACRITLAGIRHQFPEASLERLELQRRMDGTYDH